MTSWRGFPLRINLQNSRLFILLEKNRRKNKHLGLRINAGLLCQKQKALNEFIFHSGLFNFQNLNQQQQGSRFYHCPSGGFFNACANIITLQYHLKTPVTAAATLGLAALTLYTHFP